jgi:hypothetical protein
MAPTLVSFRFLRPALFLPVSRLVERYTAPYRGLAAMTEADSDFFFGPAGSTAATGVPGKVLRKMLPTIC